MAGHDKPCPPIHQHTNYTQRTCSGNPCSFNSQTGHIKCPAAPRVQRLALPYDPSPMARSMCSSSKAISQGRASSPLEPRRGDARVAASEPEPPDSRALRWACRVRQCTWSGCNGRASLELEGTTCKAHSLQPPPTAGHAGRLPLVAQLRPCCTSCFSSITHLCGGNGAEHPVAAAGGRGADMAAAAAGEQQACAQAPSLMCKVDCPDACGYDSPLTQ